MPDAALRCPGCGAPASADAAACAYCGTPLATVTCPSCFAAMFRGSRFCAHCGAEAVRDVLAEETPLHCPRCRADMQALRLGSTAVHECAECGGLWLAPESLQALCDAHDEHAEIASMLGAGIPAAGAAAPSLRYVPCPRCAKLMNRVNFAHSSGVVLDVCKGHGVWLDRGELQRVLGFVDAGGLAVARQRQREQLVEERRRLTALQNMPMGMQPMDAGRYASHAWRADAGSGQTGSITQMLLDALGIVLPG